MDAGIKKLMEEKVASAEAAVASIHGKLFAAEKAIVGRCKAFEETILLLGNNPANAGMRKKFEDKIRKEKEATEELLAELAEAEARLSGFKDAIKVLEKGADDTSSPELRPGSELFRIRDAIRQGGQPLTLSQMLETLGVKDNPVKRNSVRGSIGRYAREEKIFVQTAPNTFGLLELGHKADTQPAIEPP